MLSGSATIGSQDGRVIRTYEEGWDTESETDNSEAEMMRSGNDDENEQLSIAQRLEQNTAFMNNQLAEPTTWVLRERDDIYSDQTRVRLIQKPTASQMSHRL